MNRSNHILTNVLLFVANILLFCNTLRTHVQLSLDLSSSSLESSLPWHMLANNTNLLHKIKHGPEEDATTINPVSVPTSIPTTKRNTVQDSPNLSTLSCKPHGGPDDKSAQEMVYWRDIPSDSRYVSSFRARQSQQKRFLTFEPDEGGWNNIRMSMETIVGLAIATGRTLVLPPEMSMYLLGQNQGKQKARFGFADFFPMHELAKENAGLEMITMREFLEAEAMTGKMKNKYTGEVSFPPLNKTNWDQSNGREFTMLKLWLRRVTHTPLWRPENCMVAFPASGDVKDVDALRGVHEEVYNGGSKLAEDVEIPVDASPMERLKDNLGWRENICVYDENMQKESVLHFMCDRKKARMLVHFYGFLFFEDWREDLWMKRFMRDHVRYIDPIQCAAGRIVHALREYVTNRKTNSTANQNGDFDSFHIRRGEFQFKETRISAEEIYKNTKDILTPGAVIFIATDERDKQFFDPLREHYDIKFLDDFVPLLEGINTNHYGMIEQLVASRGRAFFGCFYSTFSGYIHRLRGYHSVKDNLYGNENGILPSSYYYSPTRKKYAMQKYSSLSNPPWSREFPTSWRGIDKGIGFVK